MHMFHLEKHPAKKGRGGLAASLQWRYFLVWSACVTKHSSTLLAPRISRRKQQSFTSIAGQHCVENDRRTARIICAWSARALNSSTTTKPKIPHRPIRNPNHKRDAKPSGRVSTQTTSTPPTMNRNNTPADGCDTPRCRRRVTNEG